jgi:hypothetical protein
MLFNPAPEAEIIEGDPLITLGPKNQQDQRRTLAG